ncbi:MAG: hypothetical protein WC527_07950 [Candidatus Margulisiibacteriota bacterium]
MKRAVLALCLTLIFLSAGAVCFAAVPPDFELYINGIRAQNNDTISSTPSIEVRIIGTSSLDATSIRMAYSRGSATTEVTDFTKDIISSTECRIYYKPTSAFDDGTYVIFSYANNFSGEPASFEATGLRILGTAAVSLQGNPLNYPNPFDPSSGTYISYYLTKNSSISINIYDLAGDNLIKIVRSAGTSGGSAGYNEVFWDGTTGSGQTVGNGMYAYLIIADGAVTGKGKMVALKR